MPCRRGFRCRNPYAPYNGHGLCYSCEAYGRESIKQFPADYRELAEEIYPLSTGLGSEISGSRVDPPLPFRSDIDAQMRHIRWMIVSWVPLVRAQAKLTNVSLARVNHEAVVAWGAQVLQDHYAVLLALDTAVQLSYRTGRVVPMDGVQAVIEMIEVHQRTPRLIGMSRVWEEREMPCPKPPLSNGCGSRTLGTYVGSGKVECVQCGWYCTLDEYAEYVLTNIPRGERR